MGCKGVDKYRYVLEQLTWSSQVYPATVVLIYLVRVQNTVEIEIDNAINH
jgi:hypothetical protein